MVDFGLRTLANGLLERMRWARLAGLAFGDKRDLYEVLGYPRVLTVTEMRETYQRGGIAGRIVDAFPNATWRGTMEIIEDENPEKQTPFEQAWLDLDKRLQVQAKLLRVDKLAGLSTYAVLLIGAEGNLEDELPKGRGQEDILYLTPFCGAGGPGVGTRNTIGDGTMLGADATIHEFDTDIHSPRFGLPKSYTLRRTDINSAALTRPVHWSRIIHIAENVLDDEVYGQPALERVWNLLMDLEKVTGGGAEAFWLRANQGLHLDLDPDMPLEDVKGTLEALNEQSEKYKHQMTRWLRTRGVDVKTLGSDVANFGNPADAILTQIAGAKGIPKRILTGSEMGELASSQDRDNWKDQINGRQTGYAGPYIVRPLVDRLIKYGYLPTPMKGADAYEVRWPNIQVLTEHEKSTGAQAWANTKTADGLPVFTSAEIRDKWYQMAPLEKAQLEEQKKLAEVMMPPQPEPEVMPAPPEAMMLAAERRKFSSTQVQIPEVLAKRFLDFGRMIPDDELASDGREDDAHVTVKYGLHTNAAEDVQQALNDFIGPVDARFGKTAYFEGEDHDVVYVSVDSPSLVELNQKIASTLEVTDTYPKYVPHATIAYVKKGMGKKYADDERFTGLMFATDKLMFMPREGEPTELTMSVRTPAAITDDEDALVSVLEAALRTNNEDVLAEILGPNEGALISNSLRRKS